MLSRNRHSQAVWQLVVVAMFFCIGRVFAERPNIIVIYTDDQGYGDASCLNPEAKFQTPNLDRLATEGITFRNAHCADTVCTPSRYGLLTGRYCWRTSMKTGVMGAEGKCLISDNRITLASLLRGHQRGQVSLLSSSVGCFGKRTRGRPRGRMVDSRLSRRAIDSI